MSSEKASSSATESTADNNTTTSSATSDSNEEARDGEPLPVEITSQIQTANPHTQNDALEGDESEVPDTLSAVTRELLVLTSGDRNRILEGERIRAGNGNITSEETLAMIRVMPSEALSGEDDDAANDDAESPEEEALASTTQEQGLDVHTQNDTLEVNAPGSSLSTAEVFNRMQASLIATNPATNLQVQHLEDSTITADEIAIALQAPPNEDTSTDGTNEPAQSDPENQAVEEDAAPAETGNVTPSIDPGTQEQILQDDQADQGEATLADDVEASALKDAEATDHGTAASDPDQGRTLEPTTDQASESSATDDEVFADSADPASSPHAGSQDESPTAEDATLEDNGDDSQAAPDKATASGNMQTASIVEPTGSDDNVHAEKPDEVNDEEVGSSNTLPVPGDEVPDSEVQIQASATRGSGGDRTDEQANQDEGSATIHDTSDEAAALEFPEPTTQNDNETFDGDSDGAWSDEEPGEETIPDPFDYFPEASDDAVADSTDSAENTPGALDCSDDDTSEYTEATAPANTNELEPATREQNTWEDHDIIRAQLESVLGPLPSGWDIRFTSFDGDARMYFVNHNTHRTFWNDPRLSGPDSTADTDIENDDNEMSATDATEEDDTVEPQPAQPASTPEIEPAGGYVSAPQIENHSQEETSGPDQGDQNDVGDPTPPENFRLQYLTSPVDDDSYYDDEPPLPTESASAGDEVAHAEPNYETIQRPESAQILSLPCTNAQAVEADHDRVDNQDQKDERNGEQGEYDGKDEDEKPDRKDESGNGADEPGAGNAADKENSEGEEGSGDKGSKKSEEDKEGDSEEGRNQGEDSEDGEDKDVNPETELDEADDEGAGEAGDAKNSREETPTAIQANQEDSASKQHSLSEDIASDTFQMIAEGSRNNMTVADYSEDEQQGREQVQRPLSPTGSLPSLVSDDDSEAETSGLNTPKDVIYPPFGPGPPPRPVPPLDQHPVVDDRRISPLEPETPNQGAATPEPGQEAMEGPVPAHGLPSVLRVRERDVIESAEGEGQEDVMEEDLYGVSDDEGDNIAATQDENGGQDDNSEGVAAAQDTRTQGVEPPSPAVVERVPVIEAEHGGQSSQDIERIERSPATMDQHPCYPDSSAKNFVLRLRRDSDVSAPPEFSNEREDLSDDEEYEEDQDDVENSRHRVPIRRRTI